MKKYSDDIVKAIGLAAERLSTVLITEEKSESLTDLRTLLNFINKLSELCEYEDPFATYLEKKKDANNKPF